jgi:hypothetical protein
MISVVPSSSVPSLSICAIVVTAVSVHRFHLCIVVNRQFAQLSATGIE